MYKEMDLVFHNLFLYIFQISFINLLIEAKVNRDVFFLVLNLFNHLNF
jgi:hypothetical protein